eukprot:CAMPEP_0197908506 /NCGR_PEP_ID=MMETSP1439-20131203/66944_1 /TAXON_ID=66791 /ORGANISM="Gonyaulax spinifera, Strain CCMP409" /LENGTH=68 /DNA_ID=CAMNT_0043530005 /DNA_START=13 /DNA_END=215 /DNA_ORIENTATION=-
MKVYRTSASAAIPQGKGATGPTTADRGEKREQRHTPAVRPAVSCTTQYFTTVRHAVLPVRPSVSDTAG